LRRIEGRSKLKHVDLGTTTIKNLFNRNIFLRTIPLQLDLYFNNFQLLQNSLRFLQNCVLYSFWSGMLTLMKCWRWNFLFSYQSQNSHISSSFPTTLQWSHLILGKSHY